MITGLRDLQVFFEIKEYGMSLQKSYNSNKRWPTLFRTVNLLLTHGRANGGHYDR